jgi:hypothetical protein
MLIVREAIGFSGSLFRALGQKRGQISRSHGHDVVGRRASRASAVDGHGIALGGCAGWGSVVRCLLWYLLGVVRYLLPILSYVCNTFVIGVSTEITTKLPSRDLQDTVHIVYFYIAWVGIEFYSRFVVQNVHQLTYTLSTVAFTWRARTSMITLFSLAPAARRHHK